MSNGIGCRPNCVDYAGLNGGLIMNPPAQKNGGLIMEPAQRRGGIICPSAMPGDYAPQEEKYVKVDGQQYEVKKVPAKSNFMSIMPTYKEVVVIDGKEYDVKTVRDPKTCDGTKQVVIIDGKQYDVKDGQQIDLSEILGGILA